VIIIGAGASGLAMGIKLLEAGNRNFRIYEKAARCGGTWRENTYPNVACDVPSPSYAYSFDTNPEWGWRFARGEEIQRYLERCERKYGLAPYIEYTAKSTAPAGTASTGKSAPATVARTGPSAGECGRCPAPSALPGDSRRGQFRGAAFHTARWDHSVDLYHSASASSAPARPRPRWCRASSTRPGR
jgi:cation diffusion facilitator CzcD-associated flavoprotein CzcO